MRRALQKMVRDTERGLSRLTQLEAEIARLTGENQILANANTLLKMDIQVERVLPRRRSSKTPVESILPDYNKLDTAGRNCHTRLRQALHKLEIETIADLQKIGGPDRFKSLWSTGKRTLDMLLTSMTQHGIEWKKS